MSKILCPKCDSEMVIRNGKYGQFYGCTQYSNGCRGTRNYESKGTTIGKAYKGKQTALAVLPSPPKTAIKKLFNPSSEQQVIKDKLFTIIESGNRGSVMVNSTAGSGKSSSLKWLSEYIEDLSVCYLVFGSENKAEAQAKMPSNIDVFTTHGYGLRAIELHNKANGIQHTDLKSNKVYNALLDTLPDKDKDKREYFLARKHVYPATQIISKLKNCYLPPDDESIQHVIDLFQIDISDLTDNIPRLFHMVKHGMAESLRNLHQIDFDDMLWLPVALKMKLPKYDIVLCDEVQDFNMTQLLLTKDIYNIAMVLVGDVNQAIYLFRGAMPYSMQTLADTHDSEQTPMTITWRNPTSHVKYINEEMPHIEHNAAPNAIEGSVEYSNTREIINLPKGSLILNLTNAPLIEQALSCWENKIPAVIKGKDYGYDIENEFKQIMKNPYELSLSIIQKKLNDKIGKLIALGYEGRAAMIQDKLNCCEYLYFECESYSELFALTNKLFRSNPQHALEFSTVHKAKGLERPVVAVMNHKELGNPWGDSEYEKIAANNTKFVALTRSSDRMILM